MKTRNKILMWTGAVCLIALAVWAANPSFSDFNSTQFNTAGNKVALKGNVPFNVQNVTTSYTVAVGVYEQSFSNTGAGGTATVNLPAALPGMTFTLVVETAGGFRFTFQANGTDTIQNVSTVGGAGGSIYVKANGSCLTLKCVVAGQWVVSVAYGGPFVLI